MLSSSPAWLFSCIVLLLCNITLIPVQGNSRANSHVDLGGEYNYQVRGGRLAKKDERPYQVLVSTLMGGFPHVIGSAAIYNSKWLITAAHLMFHNGNRRLYKTVRYTVGKTDMDDYVEGQETFSALRVVVHPKFDPSDLGLGYDIALVRLRYPIVFTNTIQPIAIATSAPSGTGSVSGWAYTFHKRLDSAMRVVHQSKYLQIADLTLVPQDECTKKYEAFNASQAFYGEPSHKRLQEFQDFWPVVANTTICGQNLQDLNACFGDSGGPLVCSSGGKPSLCGIFSQGLGCTVGLMPEIFTNVADFSTWIVKIAGNADGSRNTDSMTSVTNEPIPMPERPIVNENSNPPTDTNTNTGGTTNGQTGSNTGTTGQTESNTGTTGQIESNTGTTGQTGSSTGTTGQNTGEGAQRPDYDDDNNRNPTNKPNPVNPISPGSIVTKNPKDCKNDTKKGPIKNSGWEPPSMNLDAVPPTQPQSANLVAGPPTQPQSANLDAGPPTEQPVQQRKRDSNNQFPQPFVIEPGKIYTIEEGKLRGVRDDQTRVNGGSATGGRNNKKPERTSPYAPQFRTNNNNIHRNMPPNGNRNQYSNNEGAKPIPSYSRKVVEPNQRPGNFQRYPGLPMMRVKEPGRFNGFGYFGTPMGQFPPLPQSSGTSARNKFIQDKNSRRREGSVGSVSSQ